MEINKRLIAAYIWGAAIFTISSIPYLETPGPENIGLDKLAHFGLYLILGILVFRGWNKEESKAKALPYIIIFAIIDELHQVIVPGRYVEFTDLIANFTGIFCAKLITRRKNENIQETTDK